MGYNFFNIALLKQTASSKEIIAVVPRASLQAVQSLFHSHFLPNVTFLIKADGDKQAETVLAYLSTYQMIDGMPTFYICQNMTCSAPITDFEQLKTMLLT